MAKKVKEDLIEEVQMNVFQACNHFQMTGRNRRVAEKKYHKSVMTETDWEQSLSHDNLI